MTAAATMAAMSSTRDTSVLKVVESTDFTMRESVTVGTGSGMRSQV